MPSRRDRYNDANIRGGLGVRKRLSEESFRTTYRLNGVQRGATIAECLDKYGRWEGGHRLGVLVRQSRDSVYVKWDDEDEIAIYKQGDARYQVDRDRWRITNPRIGSPLEMKRGESALALEQKKSKQDSDPALTGPSPTDRFRHRQNANSTDRGDENMPAGKKLSNAAAERSAAQKAIKDGSLQERETYTAKQVATRCGTDPKTMRKFFRSSHSTVEPVGQGGRYEFDARDLPKIKQEFTAWSNRGRVKKAAEPAIDPAHVREVAEQAAEEDEEFTPEEIEAAILAQGEQELAQQVRDHFGDDREPTAEELEAMAALNDEEFDLDLDDLDADDIEE